MVSQYRMVHWLRLLVVCSDAFGPVQRHHQSAIAAWHQGFEPRFRRATGSRRGVHGGCDSAFPFENGRIGSVAESVVSRVAAAHVTGGLLDDEHGPLSERKESGH